MKPFRALGGFIFLLLLAASGVALAEEREEPAAIRTIDFYVSLYGGVNSPFKTDFIQTGPGVNINARDLKLEESASIGGKVGFWMTGARAKTSLDFGAELDVMNFNPDFKAGQRLNGTANGVPTTITLLADGDINATLYAVNLLVRLPIGVTPDTPHGRWFPYLGIGGGFQTTSFCRACSKEAVDTAPAFQGLAGVKVFLFKQLALFGEYKFTHAVHTFETEIFGGGRIKDELDFNVNHFVGGLSLHF
jgi:opacity protein-like surface antigen